METMKKQWGRPLTSVQEFVPQEYCGACQSTSGGLYEHTADCLKNGTHAYIFYDTNGGGISATENRSLSSGSHGGCGLNHTWYDNSPTVTPNAVIVLQTQAATYCDRISGYGDNAVYALKSQYVDHPELYYKSTDGTAVGPTWAIVIDNAHSATHTWIVSPNQTSWKTVVS